MFGHPHHFRSPSGGPRQQPPPLQHPFPQPLNPNFSLQNQNQNPTNSSYILPPNPAFPSHPVLNPYPAFPTQNPNFTPQKLPNSSFRPQTLPENPRLNVDPQQLSNSAFSPQSLSDNPNVGPLQHPSNSAFWPKEMLERIDGAAEKARAELVAAGRSVSAWKVLESALLMLKVDAWSSLMLPMHQVPSLHRLMLTEGRINSYIHCFVGVRKITSLYDLELAICKNENIQQFEELGLGPLLLHPLVLHYFQVSSDTTEVFKITSEEIVFLLIGFQTHKREVTDDSVEEFLDFIVKRRSVASKEKLGIRICSLGVHVSYILEAKKLERAALRKSKKELRPWRSRKKPPIFSTLKKRLDKHFCAISQQAELFSVVHKDFCVKQDRFVPSSPKHGGNRDYSHEEDDKNNDDVTGSQVNFSSQSAKISERASSCTNLSAIEERCWLESTHISPVSESPKHNEGNGSVKKKRKYGNLSSPISVPIKLRKSDKVDQDVLPTKNGCGTEEFSDVHIIDLSITDTLLRMFVTTWKEACQEQPVAKVLWSMLRSYNTHYKKSKTIMSMFYSYPLIGLLNVAVSSIKFGMWDSMYDTFQSTGQHGLTNTCTHKCSEYLSTDVEPSIKDAVRVSTEHDTEHTLTCMEQDQQYYPRRERVHSRRKVLQTSQKNNIHKGLSGGSPSESKVCFLCGQAGHVCKDCSQLQQAVSSLAPQNPQKLVRYPAQSYTSVQLLPVESQPQQSTNRAPMPQKSRCAPVGRGQVFRVTGGEAMEERVNAVINDFTGVSVEDIIRKVATFFESDHGMPINGKTIQEKMFLFFRKLCNCELWLVEEFCVKEFRCLGFGEFLMFLEKYACLLPHELCKFLTVDGNGKCPLEVCMLQDHLVVLVSQALNSLWEDEKITKLNIPVLLRKQFPSIGFQTIENGSVEDFLSLVGKHKNTAISKRVLFSMTLCGTSYGMESPEHCKNDTFRSTLVNANIGQTAETHESVTSKDAIKILLRGPMMSDLNLWAHWDLLFAPYLGTLVPWLLNEVNTDELLCLVTKDGKVIRLDHSSTVDAFLEAVLQGSSFQTAVKMLSLFALFGGEKHVPVSLLKLHVQHAFEVILKNYVDNMEIHGNKNFLSQGEALCRQQMIGEGSTSKFCNELHRDVTWMNTGEPVLSRFVIDCLGYLPAEFRSFAADVLLSGMRSIFKHAASAILSECNQTEQRLMIHEVGLSLGIVEWIHDYNEFCSYDTTDLFMSGATCFNAVRYETGSGSKYMQDVSDTLAASEGSIGASVGADKQKGECTEPCIKISGAEASEARIGSGSKHSPELNELEDAVLVIESIRRDEFGLDSSLSNVGSSILKKQHARLGRALRCLSEELYSQDSHFLLELVQNADDNIYPTNVEPTLTFILQESGIVVLNNERGFSAQNIRALCDVGNSTKKGSKAGYIGQKGIGFKSVFRVTDAPEIHSNGFHIKFDISEGQIGLILPTVVPPRSIHLFSSLASSDNDKADWNCWNTCIVLPFRSILSDRTVMKSVINMFSDLHPSLLLFLHRLQCIKFRNLLDDTLTVMRKDIVGDGIVKISHGKEKMTWFVVSQKLQADFIRGDVQTTEISIAFTLKESDNGDYSPDIAPQPVFAFLPLRTYGLKFILQGDFVLPSSREEVDGDSPWNQWLLSEFPGLFVNAERSFCALPCFKENPGRAVTAYMSFVPLVGDVHGFFSSLPRLIISKLRVSNCLLLEGGNNEWVPPCRVLRGWNKQARLLLSDDLLQEHLGLGFLDKNIVVPDPLARVLGIVDYGPKVLLQIVDSLCHTQNGLKSMGLSWLASWLSSLYAMSFNSSVEASFDSGVEMEFIENLRKIPFIPLSDGTYVAVDKGPIWLHFDALKTGFEGQHGLESFPDLYATLQIVSPSFLFASCADMSYMNVTTVEKVTSMLRRIGVQQLSAHEIIKVHILPAISDGRITDRDKNLMTDYICFVMVHLQSSCYNCRVEKEYIISELRNKAYILTNNGFTRPAEASIHFSAAFGNPVDINNLINGVDMVWHEVDISYLKHPTTRSLPNGLLKWREFFQKIGITDFVKVVQVEKGINSLSDSFLKKLIWDKDSISLGLNATDWESPELVQLLSLLSRENNKKGCEYLLEVLDTLWDDCYSDKTTGYCTSKSVADRQPFRSSFISCICDVQWVVSTMDDELHYPKDLYHNCDPVRSILGTSAPFSVPKVRSGKFASDIGFKTRVSIGDVFEILKLWRCENPFRASLAQMFKIYSLIWNEMAPSNQRITDEFHPGPFIFVPYEASFSHEDVVSGIFLSPEEVYWDDSTSFVNHIKGIRPQYSSTGINHIPLNKMLSNFYPGLHDFFVGGCGVHEIPALRSYLRILLDLSNIALPSQAANAVFRVFLKWTDGLKSGLSAEDIVYLKDSLTNIECTVLPTVQDKWVSLHPSFGHVFWCDDIELRKQFMHLDGVDFLYFGELSNADVEMLFKKVSILLKALGIPALSEAVTREAIFYGLADCSTKAALMDWTLPYAQRYLQSVHPDKYTQLKQSGFDILNRLQVVVVEKLFYQNVIKSSGRKSNKRLRCSCLLQGSNLYTTQEPDSHALFVELSRLFFDGNPELHLANFLHMITIMAESGSTQEQTEFFILNSQKVPKLSGEESVWSLSSVTSLTDNYKSLPKGFTFTEVNEKNSSKSKRKVINWPPIDWKTTPGFGCTDANLSKTQAPVAHSVSVDINWTIEDDSAMTSAALVLPGSDDLQEHSGYACNETGNGMHTEFDPINVGFVSDSPDLGSFPNFSKRDQPRYGTSSGRDAMLTGRLGELVAFKYLISKAGKSVVKWVNECNETGLPYDIVVGEKEDSTEFIEVKATQSPRKDWFHISMREWQFAVDKGEAFSILHVILLGNNAAKVSVYKNPVQLCMLGKLKLHLMMPKQQNELFLLS
ncbi:unnamed protein product [Prunus armeniaca]